MKNAEQPAFPRAGSEHTNLADHITHEPTEGLTKREYFAAIAMGQLVNAYDRYDKKYATSLLCTDAVRFADELLKALES